VNNQRNGNKGLLSAGRRACLPAATVWTQIYISFTPKTMELLSHKPNFKGIFPDKRLDKRAEIITSQLIFSRTSSVKGSTKTEADQKGFYRFLENEQVDESKIVKELTQRCSMNVNGRDVLVIQDTTSIGLSKHSNRIKPNSGVGFVGNKVGLGFLAHGSLVLDANNETMLGFSDVHLWHREEDKSNNTTRAYKKQFIEDKESFRWIQAGLNSKQILESARSITIIEDREGDIYEQFCLLPDDKTHLIIRSRDNRKLADGSRLYDLIALEPISGTFNFKVDADKRKGRKARIATIEVRHKKVTLQKPSGKISKELPDQLDLYVVEAKEINGPKKDSIKWCLLTTHDVTNFQEAIDVINSYRLRWYIEQVFRLLKKEGFKIEDSELTTGWAIRKLTVLLLNNILRVMQMLMAYGNEESQPIQEVFSNEEIKCLKLLASTFEQKKTHVQNPYSSEKLSWASWLIARLGGWKGYTKQRPPGPITMKRGLDMFDLIYQGWMLAKQIEKDVSTR
jgi:hypothetical protein